MAAPISAERSARAAQLHVQSRFYLELYACADPVKIGREKIQECEDNEEGKDALIQMILNREAELRDQQMAAVATAGAAAGATTAAAAAVPAAAPALAMAAAPAVPASTAAATFAATASAAAPAATTGSVAAPVAQTARAAQNEAQPKAKPPTPADYGRWKTLWSERDHRWYWSARYRYAGDQSWPRTVQTEADAKAQAEADVKAKAKADAELAHQQQRKMSSARSSRGQVRRMR